MEERGWITWHGFWPLALLGLPIGVAAQAAVRFLLAGRSPGDLDYWPAALTGVGSHVLVAPCGMPLALGCRRLSCLGYRRSAWLAGTVLGAVAVRASLMVGPPGPQAVATMRWC